MKRAILFVHRWLGVVLAVPFLVWFLSGIGMMYWEFPSAGRDERVDRSPALDAATIRVSPQEAAARAERPLAPPLWFGTFGGRPVYRFGAERAQTVVYADTGEVRGRVADETIARVAAAWTGQPVEAAAVDHIGDIDQWTLQVLLWQRPLRRYSWTNGEQVYVSLVSGEVVQFTTTASRWGAYVGAIPHWFYFTPLRRNAAAWSRTVIWSSAVGTFAAVLGLVVGIWMYSPSGRYRFGGAPARIPYQGWKRWHMLVGLIFGLAAATWAFSGMLSMDPLPRQRAEPLSDAPDIARALRGNLRLDGLTVRDPRAVLAALGDERARELELASFDGEAIWLAYMASNDTRIVPMAGSPQAAIAADRVAAVVGRAAGSSGGAMVEVLERYDRYYLDRRGRLPLPVIKVSMDAPYTRDYIDPKTARVVEHYQSQDWLERWLYHGLHSFNFPWLYNYRPLWDIVVITFMLGGTGLSCTSMVLAWRVLGRKLAAFLST